MLNIYMVKFWPLYGTHMDDRPNASETPYLYQNCTKPTIYFFNLKCDTFVKYQQSAKSEKFHDLFLYSHCNATTQSRPEMSHIRKDDMAHTWA